jgi:hypothetical protein
MLGLDAAGKTSQFRTSLRGKERFVCFMRTDEYCNLVTYSDFVQTQIEPERDDDSYCRIQR